MENNELIVGVDMTKSEHAECPECGVDHEEQSAKAREVGLIMDELIHTYCKSVPSEVLAGAFFQYGVTVCYAAGLSRTVRKDLWKQANQLIASYMKRLKKEGWRRREENE